ncbi:MAG: PAS domain S-box protein [Porticoccus sp.]|nr:PAS domain S-box protein [Porticoccus sp.]
MKNNLEQQIGKLNKENQRLSNLSRRFELAIDGARLGTWDWDITSGQIIYNAVWAEFLGYTLDELEPNIAGWSNLLHPDDIEHVNQTLNNNLNGTTSFYDCEYRVKEKSGKWVWIRARGEVVERSTDGTALRHAGSSLVIDDLKQAEQDLQLSERRYSNLFNHAVEAIIVTDESGIMVSFNHAAEQLFGYEASEVINKNVSLLVSSGFKKHHDSYIKNFHKTTDSKKVIGAGREVYGQHKGGQHLELHISISESVHHGNRCFMAMIRDIAHIKNAQRILSEREKNFRLFANSSFEGIYIHDDGILLHANDRFFDLFQYQNSELLNHQIIPLLFTDDSINKIEKRVKEKSIGHYETECIKKDGSIFIAEILPRNHLLNGRHVRAVAVRDITEYKEQQKTLQRAKDVAESANRAKSQFLSSMSHELRTPLNAIMGYAQIFQLDADASEGIKSGANEILSGGRHLLALIDDILDLAQIESNEVKLFFEKFKMNGLINECMLLVQSSAQEKGITVTSTNCNHLNQYVYADRIKLKQSMLNLLTNAIKYNEIDGSVLISCAMNGNELSIKVSDTGQGLSASQLSNLFQPFNRLGAEKSNTEGTGIGLVITKQLIEKMNGRIGVKSELGVGSTFWLTLPVYDVIKSDNDEIEDTDKITTDKNSGVPEQLLTPTHILYVEDNKPNRLVMKSMLENRKNTELTLVNSAESALTFLHTNRPELVLLDIDLPGMSGYQFFDLLQDNEVFKDIPVIAVTSNAMVEDIERAKQYSFSAYLSKPIMMDQLYDAIDSAIQTPQRPAQLLV